MTLQRRLLLASVLVLAVLVASGLGVLAVQRAMLIGQLDAELVTLASSPRAVLVLSATDRGAVALADVYVGRLSGGRLVTVLAPDEDPALVPRVAANETIPSPVGRETVSGKSPRVRVVTATLRTGVTAVFAIPTAAADAAIARLALALAVSWVILAATLGALIWWVYRLGVRPLNEVARAAEAISRGQRGQRVALGAPGTEAARLGSAFNVMAAATEASEERLRRFVADASHELRTPLTVLQGYSSLPLAEVDAPTRDALARINAESRRMRRIVDDLFLMTDLDSHGIARRERVDLGPLIQDVVDDALVVQPGRPVTAEVGSTLVVIGDSERLIQALTALTSNALRHTDPSTALLVRGSATAGVVRVEVIDTGPGIATEHLPHLYERFYRADPARGRGQGGSGLGLAIVAAVIRAHGGRYGVASEPGRGTTFWFELPCAT